MTKRDLVPPPSSWFPVRIIYLDTKKEVLVNTPQEIRTGVEFIVTETRVQT